jgi:hypothetical protein
LVDSRAEGGTSAILFGSALTAPALRVRVLFDMTYLDFYVINWGDGHAQDKAGVAPGALPVCWATRLWTLLRPDEVKHVS